MIGYTGIEYIVIGFEKGGYDGKKIDMGKHLGKSRLENCNAGAVKKLTDSGANVFMAGKNADGRVGLPINFAVWDAPNNDIRNEMVDFLYTCMAKALAVPKNDPLAYKEIMHL